MTYLVGSSCGLCSRYLNNEINCKESFFHKVVLKVAASGVPPKKALEPGLAGTLASER